MRSLAGAVGAFLVGAVSGVAGVLIHQAWWGLVLALTAAVVTLVWLPAGAWRLAFAIGWMVPVARGALPLPAGDFLVSSNATGWSFLSGSFIVLLSALASLGGRSRRAADHELRGRST